MAEKDAPIHVALYRQAINLAMGTHPLAKFVPVLLLLADSVLCSLIISHIPCRSTDSHHLHAILMLIADTEIDWKAYMEQIEQFVNGERDYTMIKGGTGPLVYPAAHVYVYWALYQITDKGKNILLAQRLFGVLYLSTIAIVMACYKRAKVYLTLYMWRFNC